MYNTLFWILILILLLNFIIERVLEYLNKKNQTTQLPASLEGIYDAEKYARSIEYNRTKQDFGLVVSVFNLMIVLTLLFTGGFAAIDLWAAGIAADPLWHTLLFFGVLAFGADILNIPFSLYSIFVIEEKYGFNRTTWATFLVDKIKGYFLMALIGGSILALFVLFYYWAGVNFWIYLWIAMSIITIIFSMFYASILLPLFNKLTPLPEGELRTAIENYSHKVDFKLDNIFVMDGSKRSTKSNAFFTGLGKRKTIVLFDTLIEKHSIDELVAVLAHEIGHYKKKHTLSNVIISVLQSGLMLFLLAWAIDNPALSEALGGSGANIRLGLLAFGILYTPVSVIIGILMNMLSRKYEFEADQYATETYNGNALQLALKKLSVDNLSNLNPHPAYVFVHYSHPPLLQRLKAIDEVKEGNYAE
ncbi:MAG: M48 family metallopeptidase [Bacteroidia bacterium]